jgi:hypothetical protein
MAQEPQTIRGVDEIGVEARIFAGIGIVAVDAQLAYRLAVRPRPGLALLDPRILRQSELSHFLPLSNRWR